MFGKGTVGHYTTPMVKAQKRFWADVMSHDYLRKTAAPNLHKATCELLELWKLKASTVYLNQPFAVLDDFKTTTLDAVWVAMVGEEAGLVRDEIQQLQDQISGKNHTEIHRVKPAGRILQEQLEYIGDTITRNSQALPPKWA